MHYTNFLDILSLQPMVQSMHMVHMIIPLVAFLKLNQCDAPASDLESH